MPVQSGEARHEDVARDGLVRATEDDFAALRAAERRVLLLPWVRGVVRNVVHERFRPLLGFPRVTGDAKLPWIRGSGRVERPGTPL
jgi:hypothetical protein